MSVFWRVIDPIAPGSLSMFLLMALLYWVSFGLVAFTVARHVPWLGIATVILAFAPPAFFFTGMIWRDMLFADVWLCAAALTYATATCRRGIRWPAQTLAMLLVLFGVLLRPNAIIAAPHPRGLCHLAGGFPLEAGRAHSRPRHTSPAMG